MMGGSMQDGKRGRLENRFHERCWIVHGIQDYWLQRKKAGYTNPAFFMVCRYNSVTHGVGIFQGEHVIFPDPLIPDFIDGGFLDHLQAVFHLRFRRHRLAV